MMRTRYCLAAGAMGLLLVSGCRQGQLAAYAPRGPSGQPDTFWCLVEWPARHWVVEAVEENGIDQRSVYAYEVDHLFCARLSQPTFRSLCGLVNTYFQKWDRLIIIERLAYTEPLWYGYLVVAFGPDGPQAVTNMAPEYGSPWGWQCHLPPRPLRVDRERLAPVIADLDRAVGAASTGALLWFDAVDTPIFVLHDVRADGHAFSFGIRGYGEEGREWLKYELASRFLEDQEVSRLLNKGKAEDAEFALYGSARGDELKMVGAHYARLMARVWESTLGLEDATILGNRGSVLN
jgi:hypothetical protein